jgi:hypothetical protein
MGIRFSCPNGHKLNVKDNLAGKRGICPACGAKFVIPASGEPGPAAGQPAGDTATSAQSAAAGGSSSPSIVIALADAPPKFAPAIAPAIPAVTAPSAVNINASQPSVTTPSTAAPAPKVAPAPSAETPIVLTDSNHPAAVSKYTAHRMRIRRLQTMIAIALLIAVVVLGIVLIWVLSGGPETVSARQISSSGQNSYTYSHTHWAPSEGWSTYSPSR